MMTHTCAVGIAHSLLEGSGGMLPPENVGILDLLRVILRHSEARLGHESLALMHLFTVLATPSNIVPDPPT